MGVPRHAKTRLFGAKKNGQPQCLDTPAEEYIQQSCLYETLDVPSTASVAEIHSAYKRRALATHPDKGGAVVEFQRVLDAFQTLSDATQRQLYDLDVQQNRPRAKPVHRNVLSSLAFNTKLSRLLQQMSPVCRRDIILRRLSKDQRFALEKHLHDEKSRTMCKSAVDQKRNWPGSELCPSQSKSATGIYRASRTGGFYAKVFLYNFALQAHIRKELADVVNDHIALMKLAEHLRRAYFESGFAERAEPSALQAELSPGLVASVQVFFYNRHFIGHRHLQLNFKTLVEGLNAWEEMQAARGVPLFSGNGVTGAYTPEAAVKQWQRIKEVYLNLASGRLLCRSRVQLEEQLLSWEKETLPTRMKRDCKLWQRHNDQKVRALPSGDSLLMRCVTRLLKQQEDFLGKQPLSRKRMYQDII